MIPNDDQLAAIAKLREGELHQVPFAVLLHALASHRRSVVLEIERGPLTKKILIEDGVPVDCSSNLLHETIGRYLVSRGHLTEAQAQACLAQSVSAGITFGEAAIVDSLISASDLYRALQENLASKLLALFTWRDGKFRVGEELPALDSPLKIKVAQLVVTGIARFTGAEEVDAAVADFLGKRLFLHPQPHHPLTELRLHSAQRELASLLADGKRLDELAAETSIPFPDIVRLLYALAILGIVIPESELASARSSERLIGRETQPLQRLRAGIAEGDTGARRDALMNAYLRYRKQDAFELLGLEESANLRDIEIAYLAFSRRFAPWRFEELGKQGVSEKAEDLYLAGGRAFGELIDRDRREELLTRRRVLQKKQTKKATAERFAIQSELLDSEQQYKKGRALVEAGRFKEAIEQLAFAHDFDPQNSLYRAELAYCRFSADPARHGERADSELRETMRIDPRCGIAFYYAGLVKGRRGDPNGAEACLRKAIKLMAPDRRPIEALKTLAAESTKNTGRLRLPFLNRDGS